MVLGTLERLEDIPACDNRPEWRELLHTLIERIDVCPDGRLEVRWAFRRAGAARRRASRLGPEVGH